MESGAFNSPNYPDAYPPNVECVWTIRSSPGNRLQLSFMLVHYKYKFDFRFRALYSIHNQCK